MIFFRHISIKTSFPVILLCFAINISALSQSCIKGKIFDKVTKLPVAFASVIFQKQSLQKGVISDIHGRFEIRDSGINSITVSCIGYKQNKIPISSEPNQADIIVELETSAQELSEVIITPANNPAIRVIKNILLNKEKNNFENYEKYSYTCYFKTVIDIKLADDAAKDDSLNQFRNDRIKKQAVFISESVISSLRSNKRTENKIIAQKTSGFKDPIFVQSFVTLFHNSISFYNNSISIFELPVSDKSIAEYVSPLSDGCLSCYNFQLEDKYTNYADTIFVIDFSPKKGKNFNGLKGKIFISSNGFAIKNIVVEPFEKGLIVFKFRQDNEFFNDKWFPTNLDEEIGWESQKVNSNINAYPVYLITSKISNINYNPNINKSDINLEKVNVDKLSILVSDSIINANRIDSLTFREENSFHILDSIGKKHNFDYWITLLPKLANGKIPVTYFDIDLYKVYGHNKFEGSRLGIGLLTNDKISKYISLGGFTGYGFKDKSLKYGGQVIFDLNKYLEVKLKFAYQNNLKETGSDRIDDFSKLPFSEYLRSYIGYRFDNCIEKKVEFSIRPFRYLKVTSSLNLREMTPTYTYLYRDSNLANFRADEFRISAKYAFGEDLATIGGQRNVNFEGNPIISITYKRGINIFYKQSFTYNRIEATMDLIAYNGRIGQSNIRLASGLIDSSLPYGLLFTGEGSKNSDIPLLINNTFQTMSPYEFLSDRYINLFYSHNFGSLLFTSKKFKPQFEIVQNSGWGSLEKAAYQGIAFKQKDKVYLESGLIVSNIIRIKYINMFYLGFGVGGFYRYGYYGYDSFKENLALKLSISITLK